MSFEGCWEQMKRADEHIEDLSEDVTALLDAPPNRTYRVLDNVDAQQLEDARQVVQSRVVPADFSVRAGEVLHDLRSALDHAAWRLVTASGRTPTRRTAFPILTHDPLVNPQQATSFRAAVRGMSVRMEAVLRALQPYTDPVVPVEMHPLVVLRELCNRDTHRHLNLLTHCTLRRARVAVLHDIPKLHADGSPTGETEDLQVKVWDQVAIDICIDDTPPAVFSARRGQLVFAHGALRTMRELRTLPALLVPTLTDLADQTRYIVRILSQVFPGL